MQNQLKDYEPVKSRKVRFYSDHPGGRIVPELIKADEKESVIVAKIYLSREDQMAGLPKAAGAAQEFKGQGGFANKYAWLENCEESAVGRALDNAGYASNMKCSQEEMVKVERAENDATYLKKKMEEFTPPASKQVLPDDDPGQYKPKFGRFMGKKLSEINIDLLADFMLKFEDKQKDGGAISEPILECYLNAKKFFELKATSEKSDKPTRRRK